MSHGLNFFILASIIDDSSLLASGSADSSIKIFDLDMESVKYTFDKTNGGHTNWISALSSLGNGLLASGSYDNTIKIWDLNSAVLINSYYPGTNHQVNYLTRINDKSFASVSSFDGAVLLWKIN